AIESRGMEYHYIHLYNNDKAPQNLDAYSALIVLGGPMNVYETEKYPFLLDEERLVREAISKSIAVLGLCLGAQLIAKTAGAKVFAGRKKEIGWYPVSLTNEALDDALFTGFKKDMTVFQWHGDTFDVPSGAKRMAASELFPNQAFKLSEKIIALQFHLEVTEEAVYQWMQEYKEELNGLKGSIDPEKIRIETKEKIESLKILAQQFYDNFFKLI
ncbi:MAG: type 1 glutamine amidotransferase, partial [Nitrospinota bacterium]|nr:type 1 glutamine amidotransferase [Nitrospinota bacterium]